MEIYYIIFGMLALLSVFGLIVGVSNDACNFLNSSIGCRAGTYNQAVAVAAVGVLLGACFSSGMMSVARNGVIEPEMFTFHEVMVLYLAVMVGNIILLDTFNTLGLPTSTTVSLVFSLLGAAIGMAVFSSGEFFTCPLADYINEERCFKMVIAIFAPVGANGEAITNTPEAADAWFITMTIFCVAGLILLLFCFSQCKERVVMDAKESENVKVSDLWTEFLRNKPLRVLAFFFVTAFAMMSVGNAADAYFMSYNVGATPLMTTAFMWLGTIPAFIFMPLVPAIKRKIGKKGMFYLFLGTAIIGMAMMYIFVQVEALKRFDLLCVAQFVKSTGIIVATGYMWVLVPEVVSYGEYTSGRRIAGIVNALTGIFFKAGMALGGVVPGAVLAWVGFNAELPQQTALAEQGILWLVCVIPAILLVLAMFIISKYELSDEVVDKINREIEQRNK